MWLAGYTYLDFMGSLMCRVLAKGNLANSIPSKDYHDLWQAMKGCEAEPEWHCVRSFPFVLLPFALPAGPYKLAERVPCT